MVTPLTLDHVVIAVSDLDRAADDYRALFGLAPSWRGNHPTYGTANVLFRLDNSYIELLAPDPHLPSPRGRGVGGEATDTRPWQRGLLEHLDHHGEGLYAIALGTDDIDAAVAAARASGLTVEDPAAGDGVDLQTGARREWTNARIDPRTTRRVRAFFIQHRSPPDALPVAQPDADPASCVAGVDHIVIASSDLDATLSLWRDVLGLELRRTIAWSAASPEPSRRARTLHFLRLGSTILELAGAGAPSAEDATAGDSRTSNQRPATSPASDQRPATSDLLWGISYRVPRVARLVERLRSAGITVSDARPGRAPGTVVADLKPGFSHDVRTLFLEK